MWLCRRSVVRTSSLGNIITFSSRLLRLLQHQRQQHIPNRALARVSYCNNDTTLLHDRPTYGLHSGQKLYYFYRGVGRQGTKQGVWETEVPQRGPGAETRCRPGENSQKPKTHNAKLLTLEKMLVWRKPPPGACNATAMLIACPTSARPRRPPARECSRLPDVNELSH